MDEHLKFRGDFEAISQIFVITLRVFPRAEVMVPDPITLASLFVFVDGRSRCATQIHLQLAHSPPILF